MSLTKQLFPVIFGQGIDNKTDDKLLPNGKLRYLKNASLKKGGAIAKRFGATALGTTIFDPNLATTPTLTNIKGVAKIRESLGVFAQEPFSNYNTSNYTNADLTGQTSLMVYNQTNNKWVDQHTSICAIHTTNQVGGVAERFTEGDSAYISTSYIVYAANNASTAANFGCYIYVVDATNNAIVNYLHVPNGAAAKVLSNGTLGFILVSITGGNNIALYQVSTDGQISFVSNIITDAINAATKYFDATFSSSNFFVAYNTTGGAAITIRKYNSSFVFQSSTTIAEFGTNCVYTSTRSTGVDVFWHNAANGLRTQAFDINLATRGAIYTIDAAIANPVRRVTATDVSGAASDATVLYETVLSVSSSIQSEIRLARVSGTAVTYTNKPLTFNVGLGSEITSLDANTAMVVFAYDTDLQPTFYTALISLKSTGSRATYYIIGKSFYGLATRPPNQRLPQFQQVTASKWHVALLATRTIEASALSTSLTKFCSIYQTFIDFNHTYQFITEEIDGTTLINGGLLQTWSGKGVHELGFNHYPELISLTRVGGAGNVANGTYQYCAVYKFTDVNGNVHRSAPSPSMQIVVAGGTPQSVSALAPSLMMTNKIRSFNDLDTGKSVEIELYRTTASGTTFFLVATQSQSDFTSPTITITDSSDDATISVGAILYTTGGVLENITPPSPLFITPFKERIFSCDGNLRLYYSKPRVDGTPLQFNDALYIEMDAHGGPITGAYQLDDKLIIFKRNAIYYITGDGPNVAGGGGAFQTPIFVTAEVGCSYQSSIVNSPEGLIFNGARGIILLKPTLEIDYIGKDVEFFGVNTPYAATVVSEQNEARFLFNDGPALVYNYLYNGWSINTNETANGWQGKGSCLFQNKYVHITNDNGVYQENASFLDGANNVFTKITTGWITLNSIAGFQRVYRAILLGRFMSNHDLKITIFYDYLPKPISTVTVTPQTALNITTYSDAVLYADATYSGGTDPYELSLNLPIQKCQAVAFSIEDLNLGGTQEGFQLTAINFEIGVKATAARIKAAANIG